MKAKILFESLLCAFAVVLSSGCASPYRLQQAIIKGNETKALKLVDKGQGLEQRNERGETPLVLAALKGQTNLVGALLDHGVKVDLSTNLKRTPLMMASRNGHLECCLLLLDRGADVNAADSFDQTSVLLGSLNNQLEVIRLLLERGADANKGTTNFSPLMAASLGKKDETRQVALVEALLAKGADPNAVHLHNITTMHCAAQGGCVPVAQLLVKHGTDVNAKNEKGVTPLHNAALFEHKPMVEYLLSVGAKPEPNPEAAEGTGRLYRLLAQRETTATNSYSLSQQWRIAAQHFEIAATNYTTTADIAEKKAKGIGRKNLGLLALGVAAAAVTGTGAYSLESSGRFTMEAKFFRQRAEECRRLAQECAKNAAR